VCTDQVVILDEDAAADDGDTNGGHDGPGFFLWSESGS
jgi:hypothetical protein